MKLLFLDESGDHNLINIDPTYPIFVLAGCIFDTKAHSKLADDVKNLKQDLFGTQKILLHYADYTRNKNGFERVKEKAFRELFFARLNDIIKTNDYEILACIVDKQKLKEKYGCNAMNPYLLSLNLIVERYVFYLKHLRETGKMVAESRNVQLDNELELAYLNLKIDGTHYLPPKDIANNITEFSIRKKEADIAGLQLIDSIVTPIGRKYLNLRNFYLRYGNIGARLRKSSCGKRKGYGLMMLP